jgi:hypothetical protein
LSATRSNQVVPFWVETIGMKEQEYMEGGR